jgi:hypothetical protein
VIHRPFFFRYRVLPHPAPDQQKEYVRSPDPVRIRLCFVVSLLSAISSPLSCRYGDPDVFLTDAHVWTHPTQPGFSCPPFFFFFFLTASEFRSLWHLNNILRPAISSPVDQPRTASLWFSAEDVRIVATSSGSEVGFVPKRCCSKAFSFRNGGPGKLSPFLRAL